MGGEEVYSKNPQTKPTKTDKQTKTITKKRGQKKKQKKIPTTNQTQKPPTKIQNSKPPKKKSYHAARFALGSQSSSFIMKAKHTEKARQILTE